MHDSAPVRPSLTEAEATALYDLLTGQQPALVRLTLLRDFSPSLASKLYGALRDLRTKCSL